MHDERRLSTVDDVFDFVLMVKSGTVGKPRQPMASDTGKALENIALIDDVLRIPTKQVE